MKNKKIIAAFVAVAALIIIFAGVYFFNKPEASEGTKDISVAVIHGDGSINGFAYRTDAEYLGQLLLDNGLIKGEEGPFGMYVIEVDGEKAVYEENGAYWALYQEGEYASYGIDQTVLTDGDSFSLVYTVE